MKKQLIYLSIILLCLAACKKSYLDIQPKDFEDANSYFKTSDQFLQALNGAYDPLQGIYDNDMWALAEMRSDNTSYQYNDKDRSGFQRERIDEFTEQDDNGIVYSFFSGSYSGIARCNDILDRIDKATFADSLKSRVTGQAKFLRGLYYFNLVRLMGNVPLILHEVTSTDQAFSTAARKDPAEVYTQIIADFKDAATLLPVSYSSDQDKGRATKGAAETMLAKVYMAQQDYASAIPLLEDVRKLGYQLLPDYADIFKPTNKNNAESIFEVQFVEGNYGESSNFIYIFAPYNAGTSITGFGLYDGSGSGWNIPTQNMLDAYEQGDKRKAASINFDFTDPNTGKVVPYINKYDHPPYQVRYQTSDDFIVTRYGDALLMLAECLNEQGYSADGEAFDLLNMVRSRAGLPAKTATNADASLRVSTQEEFRKAVTQERRVELAFEDHRWFDLLRTNTASETMKAQGAAEKKMKPYIVDAAYQDIRLIYQYPRREVQLTK